MVKLGGLAALPCRDGNDLGVVFDCHPTVVERRDDLNDNSQQLLGIHE